MRQRGKRFEFEFKQIDTSKIKAADYQRTPDTKRVKEIASRFDWNLVNVVKVSFRDGVYWDFDGDHTVLACKEQNGGKDLCVWCKVYYGMTYEDEAYYFSMQNGKSKEPKLNEKLCASHKTGERFLELEKYYGVDLKEYERLIKNAGFECDFKTGSSIENTPRCHKTLLDAYKTNKDAFVITLNTISTAFNGQSMGFNQNLVKGIFLFVNEYMNDRNWSRKRLEKVLKVTEPKQIITNAKVSVNTGKFRYARQILLLYNKGLLKENKLVDRFI